MKNTMFIVIQVLATFLYGQQDTANTRIEEVVVTGTLKNMTKDKSPVPVEVYSAKFFEKKSSSCLLESVEMINGVRTQINCSVCNTADIHINGLEGPYTLVLIDGMPIVSSLSSVYGLSGIPNSMIDRVEVVKGPASSIYGSEAMGGIINVITKNPLKFPKLVADMSATTWGEHQTDLGLRLKLNDKIVGLLGINYFKISNKEDKNKDNFIDVAQQDRISVFNKWNIVRNKDRIANIALRYVYEDRYGGVQQWEKKYRGSNQIYGESIYTNRVEAIAHYQLPTKEKLLAQISYNYHNQNSFYGATSYAAHQSTFFTQIYWDKKWRDSDILLGVAVKNIYYDDNTPGTSSGDGSQNKPQNDWQPGFFLQNQWQMTPTHTLLLGYRLDLSATHGAIHSPRIAYKATLTPQTHFRLSLGTGFRVVHLFTEDHAALTGSREVIIGEALRPERSYNANLNLDHKMYTSSGYINLDWTGFYSYFTNKIIGDFETHPDKIIYQNLAGHFVSAGTSLSTQIKFGIPLFLNLGATYMNVYERQQPGGVKRSMLFAPKWSGNYAITYDFPKNWTLDITGALYGPMRLPTVPNDYRPDYSPWYHLANIQLRKTLPNIGIELYGGVKNIFNFTPKNPILRPEDPFDYFISDAQRNPYAYTFDTAYGYASMLGIRGYLGIRYIFK